MPSQEIESYQDLLTTKSLLIDKGLSVKDTNRWDMIVKGKADALRRRGESEVQIDDLTRLIDDVLGLRKNALRCFVILRAKDAIESLIDPESKPA